MAAVESASGVSVPLVEVEDLTVHYGERRVLDRVCLTIKPGEIMVIIGRSGAGKSTLLRHILGLERPRAGAIRVFGKNMSRLSRHELFRLRKRMGVAFQSGAMLDSMSVIENIELPLRHHTKLDHNTIRIMSRMKLEMVDLGGYEAFMPGQLSGGMLKRAGLARAMAMDPEVLFFDEPSAGLDPVTSAELDHLILRLRAALSMTIVIITHEIESAVNLADRVAVLEHGRLIATGKVAEIEASEDPRIQGLLRRQARVGPQDPEDYLRRLMRPAT